MPQRDVSGRGRQDGRAVLREGRAYPEIWCYKLDPGRNLGKTNALNDADLKDFVKLQANFADSDNSWNVSAHAIDRATWDLSVKNPNKAEETALREPVEIMDEILALDADSAEILASMRGLLQ